MESTPVDFGNTQVAYALKSNDELKLAKLMFSILQRPAISSMGRTLLKFGVKAKLPINAPVKATLYKHFIGGDSIKNTLALAKRMKALNVYSILDYSLEGIEAESEFDKAVDEFLENVEVAHLNAEVPFSVFKPSAIATHRILAKVTGHAQLNEREKVEYERVRQRFHKIFGRAAELGVKVMIDAEESWIQGAIDDLADEMMDHYNTRQTIALNTFQMYRKDRLDFLKRSYARCAEKGVRMGAKLVRGAYMEKERERAYQMEYPSPINDTKKDSDLTYDAAVQYCLENLDSGDVFIGTHNQNSVTLATIAMRELGIATNDERVWFSQLYGMCDHISFNLGKEQYNVAKYIPYGPVKAVIPYLMRRADENSSVAGQAVEELKLINTEMKRRNRGGK